MFLQASGPQADKIASRKASMRRLSSLANLNHLNPFTRRQSSNTNASGSPIVATSNATSTYAVFGGSSPVMHKSCNVEPPMPQQARTVRDHNRKSYQPLSDPAELRVPKSRTTSNLPVPVGGRARGSSFLPTSQSSVLLPPSRLPTLSRLPGEPPGGPPGTARQDKTMLSSASKSTLKPTRNRVMQRSDTEPLLTTMGSQSSESFPRATAFKENLTLSPIKPLSRLDLFTEFPQRQSSLSPPSVTDLNLANARDASVASNASSTTRAYGQLAAYSSPIKESQIKHRPAPLEHWSSQPALVGSESASKRVSFGGEIKQQRLISAKAPPTPPPPHTPRSTAAGVHQRLKSSSKSVLFRTAKQPTSFGIGRSSLQSPEIDLEQVVAPMPVPYWCGRFSSLSDRYRNDKFVHAVAHGHISAVETTEDRAGRVKAVLMSMYATCTTTAAKASFQASLLIHTFHRYLRQNQTRGATSDEEAVAAFVPWVDIAGSEETLINSSRMVLNDRREREASADSQVSEASTVTTSSARKKNFMERWLVKTRRSLGQ